MRDIERSKLIMFLLKFTVWQCVFEEFFNYLNFVQKEFCMSFTPEVKSFYWLVVRIYTWCTLWNKFRIVIYEMKYTLCTFGLFIC